MTHSSDGQITVTYKDVMGNDLTVVNAARVSFGKESKALGWYGPDARPLIPVLSQPDINLINYLAKHKHMSPFGHAFASFHVKAPIFVARQLVKHKFLRWNEISRRYVDDEPEFYVPDVWRGRSADKKQGSDGVVEPVIYGKVGNGTTPTDFAYGDLHLYNMLLEQGVAPEQARMVLPQSNNDRVVVVRVASMPLLICVSYASKMIHNMSHDW
jgi:thymidylate synthase (FAD)